MTDLDELLAAWRADIEATPFPDITAQILEGQR